MITDPQQTINALVHASNLPLSVLIIGVGGADFSEMEVGQCFSTLHLNLLNLCYRKERFLLVFLSFFIFPSALASLTLHELSFLQSQLVCNTCNPSRKTCNVERIASLRACGDCFPCSVCCGSREIHHSFLVIQTFHVTSGLEVVTMVNSCTFFTAQTLDADKKRLQTSDGRAAHRDIVQFVPMDKMESK